MKLRVKTTEVKRMTMEMEPVKNMMKMFARSKATKLTTQCNSVGMFHASEGEIRIDFSRPQSLMQLTEANSSLWNQLRLLRQEYAEHLKGCNGPNLRPIKRTL